MTQYLVQKVHGVYRSARMALSYLLIATGIYTGGCQRISCQEQTIGTESKRVEVSELEKRVDAGVKKIESKKIYDGSIPKTEYVNRKDNKSVRSVHKFGKRGSASDTAEDIFGKDVPNWIIEHWSMQH